MEKKLLTVWDLTPLFPSDDSPEWDKARAELEAATNKFVAKWHDRSDYLTDAGVLREALDEFEAWAHNYGTSGGVGNYFGLRSTQEEDNQKVRAKVEQMDDLATRLANEIQFFGLRLSKIPSADQERLLSSADLDPYRHWLERLFAEGKYTLSEAEEKIVNLYSAPAFSHWVKMISSLLSKEEREVVGRGGKKEVKNISDIMGLFDDPSSVVRDSAAAAFNDILRKHVDPGVAELNAVLAVRKIGDELRHIPRPDLMRHLGDDIESEVVDSLIDTVSKNFDLPQKYYQLKVKILGLPKLKYHERGLSYGSLTKTYTYDEAVELVRKVLSGVDAEMLAIFEGFVANGQIDVYPRKGKMGGAFCSGGLLIYPSYILLNHTDRIRDVLTLAHEVGHGINNELIKKKHHALFYDTPTSTAEVASTFVEDIAYHHLTKEVNDEERLALLMMRLDDDVSTIFRQIACYKLEQELHSTFRQEGYLSKEKISEIFLKNMKAYMGEAVEQSSGAENWWLYWDHLRKFFYVYSYASGTLIAKALGRKVKTDPKFIEQVKEFLAAGTSASPKEIFAKLGINIADPTFWQEGIKDFEATLQEAEQLAKKLGKVV